MRHDDDNTAGQDSFLDIVANIVGILIILVLVVGVRAKHGPVTLSVKSPERAAAEKELREDLATEVSIRADVLQTAEAIREVLQAREIQFAERGQLDLMRSVLEHKIEERRGQLDADARAAFDHAHALAAAEKRLAQLRAAQDRLAENQAPTMRIESYPTPLSKTVNGHELHLQLRDGRVTVIPWDELIAQLKSVFEAEIHRMKGDGEMTGQFGPVGGFRVRYTIERQNVSMRTYEQTGRGDTYVSVRQFSLLPTTTELGEPIETALAEGSQLRRTLAARHPGRTTVTTWVYPDDFDAFRQLKKELYALGYATAARPLCDGQPIGAAPDGSRSAAQ